MIFIEIVAIITIIYLYFGDDIKFFLNQRSLTRANISTSEKIARVKELSDDPKDIEKFITSNVNNLSEAAINKLIAKIEILKAEKVISDDSLKKRISDIALDEEFETPQIKGSKKR